MQNRIHKNIARLVMQSENLKIFDRFRRSLLSARDNELRD
jgi:hypothetical protein